MHYIKINTHLSTPIYKQIMESVQHAIQQGILKDGDMLPSESQFQDFFHVSSIVVKQAYQTLVNEGLVRSIRGKGTIVTIRPSVVFDYDIFSHYNRHTLSQDMRLIYSSIQLANDNQRSLFSNKNFSHVIRLKNVAFLKGYPIYYREVLWPIDMSHQSSSTFLSLQDCLETLSTQEKNSLKTELVYYPSLISPSTAALLNVPMRDSVHFFRTYFMHETSTLGIVYHTFPARYVTLRRES